MTGAANAAGPTRRELRSEQARPAGERARTWPFSRRASMLVAGGAAAALLLGAGGATFALWSGSATFAGAPITAGDLNITRGDGYWQQVTPGVTDPASGSLEMAAADFPSMPGDIVEVVIPIQTTLQGENLQAELSVDSRPALTSELADGSVVATYRVERADEDGTSSPVTEQIPVGTPTTVPGLQGSSAGRTDDWLVIVTTEIRGDYLWRPVATVGPAAWTLDDLTVSLDQVRPGSSAKGAPS